MACLDRAVPPAGGEGEASPLGGTYISKFPIYIILGATAPKMI